MTRLAKALVSLSLLAAGVRVETAVAGDAGNATSRPAPSVAAVEPNAQRAYRQRIWTREHGLPDNRVLSLIQTRNGYLWIGTERGVGLWRDGRRV